MRPIAVACALLFTAACSDPAEKAVVQFHRASLANNTEAALAVLVAKDHEWFRRTSASNAPAQWRSKLADKTSFRFVLKEEEGPRTTMQVDIGWPDLGDAEKDADDKQLQGAQRDEFMLAAIDKAGFKVTRAIRKYVVVQEAGAPKVDLGLAESFRNSFEQEAKKLQISVSGKQTEALRQEICARRNANLPLQQKARDKTSEYLATNFFCEKGPPAVIPEHRYWQQVPTDPNDKAGFEQIMSLRNVDGDITPEIKVHCIRMAERMQIDIEVNTGVRMLPKDADREDRLPLEYRFDGVDVLTDKELTTGHSFLVSKSATLAKKMLEHKQLEMRYASSAKPDNRPVFDISGFDVAAKAFLSECPIEKMEDMAEIDQMDEIQARPGGLRRVEIRAGVPPPDVPKPRKGIRK
ncbi:MAG: hypothetical protein JXR83_03500 [Deltaproteobacteria bacterium]|nr:hypothetical protein [Deltaproteobacteria bacterium]